MEKTKKNTNNINKKKKNVKYCKCYNRYKVDLNRVLKCTVKSIY